MSDDSKDNPPSKLKLSRDLKAQADKEETKAPPSLKLRRKESTNETPPPPPAAAPSTASLSNTPEAPEAPEAQGASEASPPSSSPSSPPPSQKTYDPEKPFGDIIKEGEIKKPKTPPPELPSKPAPRIDDGSGAKVEEAINSLNTEARQSSFLPSILVLLLLLLVLAGAGYGLWKILQAPEAPAPSTASEASTKTAPDSEASGPIQKAKAAIEKVPVADVDAITGETADNESTTAAALTAPDKEAAPAQAVQALPPAHSPINSIEDSKKIVSQYLSSVHVGGVRKGERPMILLDGRSYLLGEVVHPESGLKFDGFRKERLAFRDSHGIVYLKSF